MTQGEARDPQIIFAHLKRKLRLQPSRINRILPAESNRSITTKEPT